MKGNKTMMIQRNVKFGLATAGLLTLGGLLIFPQITPAGAQPPVRQGRGGMEKHPEIRKALRNLEQAKTNLENGAHDFEGHRSKALSLTKQAIDECKLALQTDKK